MFKVSCFAQSILLGISKFCDIVLKGGESSGHVGHAWIRGDCMRGHAEQLPSKRSLAVWDNQVSGKMRASV